MRLIDTLFCGEHPTAFGGYLSHSNLRRLLEGRARVKCTLTGEEKPLGAVQGQGIATCVLAKCPPPPLPIFVQGWFVFYWGEGGARLVVGLTVKLGFACSHNLPHLLVTAPWKLLSEVTAL